MWTLGAYMVVIVIPALCTAFTIVYYVMGNKKGGNK